QLASSQKNDQHKNLHKRLVRNHPKQLLLDAEDRFTRKQKELKRAMIQIVRSKQKEFDHAVSTLQALSPLKIMERGYSLVYSEEGTIVKSISQVEKKKMLQINLSDGKINCRIEDIKESE
ncbi:MAG: exodeoxyribonuclease VII large subunit, partial [Bacillota bacterium]|nr:exodeoxyribonuclease VII large subunit [Bacillota bacterium]